MDYSKAADAVAETIAKCGKPLTDDQKMLMAGAMAVWMEKARKDGISHAKGMYAHCQRNGINWP